MNRDDEKEEKKEITRETGNELEKTQKMLEHSQRVGKVGSWYYDLSEDIIHWSRQLYQIFSISDRKEYVPSIPIFASFIHPKDRERIRNLYNQLLVSKKGYSTEYRIVHKDGVQQTVLEQTDIVLDEQRNIVRLIGSVCDITNQNQIKCKLEENRNRFVNILNNLESGIWSMDLMEKKVQFASEGITKICGYSPDELVNERPKWKEIVYPLDLPKYETSIKQLMAGQSFSIQYRILHKNGEIKWIQDQKIPIADERNQVIRIDGIVSDIDDQKANEEKMKYLAYHDYLTGLPNLRLMYQKIDYLIEKSEEKESNFAILYLDVDRFKHVNDTLGYLIGDELLKQISERIRACLSEKDILARMNGNEFTIVIPHFNHPGYIYKLADFLLNTMEKSFSIRDYELHITASIGISIYPADGLTTDELLQNAHAGLLQAKAFGKNNYQLYTSEMNKETYKSFILEKDLRKALKGGELYLYYQPRIDSKTNQIVGAEALIRWKHPKRGIVSPGEFIPLAEKSELIIEVGDWVLETVAKQLIKWQMRGLPVVPISINIVARRFMKENWIKTILHTLKTNQVDPSLIELEITENSLFQNETIVLDAISSLKEAGIKLALDDFGTGFSSISYLRHFRFDTIKIDQSFIQEISKNEDDTILTKTIIQLAHGLNMNVVAEGVESMEQLAFLREEGCDEIQGYIYSKPLPGKEFECMLSKGTLNPVEDGTVNAYTSTGKR